MGKKALVTAPFPVSPPVSFICFIILFLWLVNLLHWNIQWSAVCSSSLHGHMGLSIIPNLWRYDLSFPCPVTNTVNSGKIGIFLHSLFLTKGRKLSHCPLLHVCPLPPPHIKSIFLHSSYKHLSWYFVVYDWPIFHVSRHGLVLNSSHWCRVTILPVFLCVLWCLLDTKLSLCSKYIFYSVQCFLNSWLDHLVPC